jgi:pimeloyl-ACP methyl ester carboxylesterase
VQVHRVGEGAAASTDVIFLHGLGGDWLSTWSSGGADGCWPRWLASDIPTLDVWCVSYEASATRWRGGSMPIRDRATSLLGALGAHDIGKRPFVLVGHSLGGLLIKQMVRHCATMGDQYADLTYRLAGVSFFSTPHTGSGLVSLAKFLKLARITPLVEELGRNQPYLRELDDWYRNYAVRVNLPHLSFFEMQDTNGIRVVDEVSGDPHLPGMTAIPVDADHRSICKFVDRQDPIYLQARRFIDARQVVPNAIQDMSRIGGPSKDRGEPEDAQRTHTTLITRTPELAANKRAPLAGQDVAIVGQSRPEGTGEEWADPVIIAEIALLALLSDQLPTGGWTRSLAHWMTSYAQASGSAAPDRPPMRIHGGIDVTCAALRRLITVSGNGPAGLRETLEGPLFAGANFLRARIPSGGAVGATIHTRTAPSEVRVRHTAITLGTLLRVQQYLTETEPYPEVVRCARYLNSSLRLWRRDTSGNFGMIAATWDLLEYLSHGQAKILSSNLRDELRDQLSTTVEEIAEEIIGEGWTRNWRTESVEDACTKFGFYGGLSSLAQSSFLFGTKILTSLHLSHKPAGLAQQRLYLEIVTTCRVLARQLLDGGASPEGLMFVPTRAGARPDIGLSVQLLSVLMDLVAAETDEEDLFVNATAVLRSSIANALMSADDARITGRLQFSHGVQVSELLDDPKLRLAITKSIELPSLVSAVAQRTMSQRYLVQQICARKDHRGESGGYKPFPTCRAFGRAWTRLLQAGYYRLAEWDESEQSQPWSLNHGTRAYLRRVRNTWVSERASALWVYDHAEDSAGLIGSSGLGIQDVAGSVFQSKFPDWMHDSASPAEASLSSIYIPTAATSMSEELLSSALRLAAELLHAPESQGMVCARFGDHRLITEQGEAVMFLEDASHLDRILHECGLRLIGIDIIDESLDGAEAVARFCTQVAY